jgi:ubiquinone/menaquinone biosynthesis C-methylase UbiE
MENAFKLKIYRIKNLFQDDRVEVCIRKTLINVFDHLGIVEDKADEIIDKCIYLAKNYKSLSEYEKLAYEILKNNGVVEQIPKKLINRADIMYNQINSYFIDGSVLDLGCGDGRVGELIAKEGHHVVLADIYRHSNIDNTNLNFKQLKKNERLPFKDNEFKNTLSLTVLHHSENPLDVLKEIYRVTKPEGRVIVIESVYGVNGDELEEAQKLKCKHYLELNSEQQRMTNIFFDHFYNRVIHYTEDLNKKVNVPFNFNTPTGWKETFEEYGLYEEKVVHLGIDQPVVPEYHSLHILKVIK